MNTMETNMDFDVLKDEIGLYILGIITKDELFEIINKKRDKYGFKPLGEFPNRLELLIEMADTLMSNAFGWEEIMMVIKEGYKPVVET